MTSTGAQSSQSQTPGIPSRHPTWMLGARHHLGPNSAVFPGALTGSRIWSTVAKTQIGTLASLVIPQQQLLNYFRQGFSFLNCKWRHWPGYKNSSKPLSLADFHHPASKWPSCHFLSSNQPRFLTNSLGLQNKDCIFPNHQYDHRAKLWPTAGEWKRSIHLLESLFEENNDIPLHGFLYPLVWTAVRLAGACSALVELKG